MQRGPGAAGGTLRRSTRFMLFSYGVQITQNSVQIPVQFVTNILKQSFVSVLENKTF